MRDCTDTSTYSKGRKKKEEKKELVRWTRSKEKFELMITFTSFIFHDCPNRVFDLD